MVVSSTQSIKDESIHHATQNNQVVRESAYYSDLRRSVDTGNKANFQLLLSLVTTDVSDHDEFHQVSTNHDFPQKQLADIYQTPAAAIYGRSNSHRQSLDNEQLNSGHFKDVQLRQKLIPEPLSYKQNVLEPELINNLDFNVRQKITNPTTSKVTEQKVVKSEDNIHSINRPNSMDVEGWFNTLSAARSLDLVS